MGEMGRATCVICGNEFPIKDMEPVMVSRYTKYRCLKCVANGDKQVFARMNGRVKQAKECSQWK